MKKRWLLTILLLAGLPVSGWLACRACLYWRLSTVKQLLRAGQPQEALAALEPTRFPPPGWVPGVAAQFEFWRGVGYRRAGLLDKAVECLERAQQFGASAGDVRREKVLVLFQSGRIDQATPLVEDLLAEPMDNETAEEVYDSLVQGYLSEYRLNDARTCLEYWLQWQPRCVKALLCRAELFEFVEDSTREEADLRLAISIVPDEFEAHLRLGGVLLKQRRVDHALAEYRWCIQRKPDSGPALIGVGSCQRQMGNLEEARAVLVAAAKYKLEPEDEAALLSEQAQIDLLEKHTDSAIAALTRAVELSPTNAANHYVLGAALSKSGRRDDAEREMERWRELEKHLNRLYDLAREIVANPHDAELRFEIGVLLCKQGKEQESFAWLTSALRCDPNHRGAHKAMAEHFERCHQPEDAEKHRELAGSNSG